MSRVPLPPVPGRPDTAGQYADRTWAQSRRWRAVYWVARRLNTWLLEH